MAGHPELDAEQAYIDHAYQCLERAREAATRLRTMVEVGTGGTEQARFERDVIEDTIHHRLAQLELGDESLCFGRIDRRTGEAFHIGRLAVSDERQEPVVVDWRAPVAEPFYRATGRESMGLARRRHFATRGRTLLDIEDELFGDGATVDGQRLQGYGTLLAALEQSRTGRLTDIVATIQGEQDEVIRADLGGVLVVQGGPGTGKTVVALHRAAYLLYTHRFPLEGQGVLLVGPNRLFLRYIERVLPSLGEAGVEQIVLADLVPDVEVRALEAPDVARVKGDVRMAAVLARAVRDRQRPLRRDLDVGVGLRQLRLSVEASERVIATARRRGRGGHNAGRRVVESELYRELAAVHPDRVDPQEIRSAIRGTSAIREALEWMWPVLTPAHLLRDLFGSAALLASAGRGQLDRAQTELLERARGESVDDVVWTDADVPLLDEARALLGPPRRGDDQDARTYGHIVVDEAQDLSPMQLRMLTRRSLNGSMTVVGDIAQATGAFAPAAWDEVLAHLPQRRLARVTELAIGYRIPAQAMALAARVLAVAAPELRPPNSVRQGDSPPRIEAARPGELAARVAEVAIEELAAVGEGTLAIVCPPSRCDEVSTALATAGVEHARGLDERVMVAPVGLVKGLEVDAALVVEPAGIVEEEPSGLRALYVALTRATKRLALVHAEPLPEVLAE